MQLEPDDEFWVVTDPTPTSEMADILFRTSLHGLFLQFKGGLTIDQHPTIFTEEAEAEAKARKLLETLAASRLN